MDRPDDLGSPAGLPAPYWRGTPTKTRMSRPMPDDVGHDPVAEQGGPGEPRSGSCGVPGPASVPGGEAAASAASPRSSAAPGLRPLLGQLGQPVVVGGQLVVLLLGPASRPPEASGGAEAPASGGPAPAAAAPAGPPSPGSVWTSIHQPQTPTRAKTGHSTE